MIRTRRITTDYYNFYYDHHKTFLETIVWGLAHNDQTFNEYMCVARVELLYVMKHYDSTYASFRTYLRTRVWYKIKHYQHDEYQSTRFVSSNIFLDNVCEEGYNHDDKLVVEEILTCLDPQQKQVISSYFLDSMTFREISAATGIPSPTVHIIKNKAIDKIKQTFNIEL